MAILLDEQCIRGLIGMPDALEAVEEVFRAAGLFDGIPEKDSIPSLAEWIKLFRNADEATRALMLENARKIQQRED